MAMASHAPNTVSLLLVEDNEIDAMGVQRAFKRSNFNNPIIIARDGYEALAKLRDKEAVPRPYIILLDLNMPKMNGIEFLHEMRKDPELKSSIVFVLTTSNAPEDRMKAQSYNIAGYIVKGMSDAGFVDAAALFEKYSQILENNDNERAGNINCR